MLKKILKVVLSRTFLFVLLLLLQVAIFLFITLYFSRFGAMFYLLMTLLSVTVTLVILEQDELNPAYKLMWVLIFVIMPVDGVLFYLLWGHRNLPRRRRKFFKDIDERSNGVLQQDPRVAAALMQQDRGLAYSANYLLDFAEAPVYADTKVEYYGWGEEFFPAFLTAIREAKKSIYMEYFIYEEGVMWDTTLDILEHKARQGVDVRVLFDGIGSLFTLGPAYEKKLRARGIQCYPFSPLHFTIHLSDYGMLNHRDHRKITVVDGEIGFSGGLNFSDEYINAIERFGAWKDNAFRLEGEAVNSLTLSFLQLWDYAARTTTRYEDYLLPPAQKLSSAEEMAQQGLVQPFSDTPLDRENVSENAYLNMLRTATDYVYISTPYLILDHETITNLTLSAKCGVDVRILTPGIPDKPAVFLVTQSYYRVLLENGVRIYEYTPGFNHAKTHVSDDKVAIVGSANMDFRSLYLHFENSTAFYGGEVVRQVKTDMQACFNEATEITLETLDKTPIWRRFFQRVARLLAPII